MLVNWSNLRLICRFSPKTYVHFFGEYFSNFECEIQCRKIKNVVWAGSVCKTVILSIMFPCC